MRNAVITVLVLILSYVTLTAQDEGTLYINQNSKENYKHMEHLIGASASYTSGVGLTYRYYSPIGIAVKATTLGWYYEETDDDGEFIDESTWFNLGLEIQYDLHKTRDNRLYLAIGGVYYFDEENSNYDEFNSFYTSLDKVSSFRIGPSVGMELFFNNLSVTFEGGAVYRNAVEENYYRYGSPNESDIESRTIRGISFSGGVTLGYRF